MILASFDWKGEAGTEWGGREQVEIGPEMKSNAIENAKQSKIKKAETSLKNFQV
jgi:hypothetical protein